MTDLQDSDVVAGLPTVFGKWFSGILFILQGPEMVVKSYKKVGEVGSYGGTLLNGLSRLPANPLLYRR